MNKTKMVWIIWFVVPEPKIDHSFVCLCFKDADPNLFNTVSQGAVLNEAGVPVIQVCFEFLFVLCFCFVCVPSDMHQSGHRAGWSDRGGGRCHERHWILFHLVP
jgi:hypothetical protein